MTRKLISSGSKFEAQIGYSRAVVVGDWVFVSGTTGFDYATMSISDSLVEQTEQCLKNIDAALRQVYGQRSFEAALSEQRAEMMVQVRDQLRPLSSEVGIEVVWRLTRTTRLPRGR